MNPTITLTEKPEDTIRPKSKADMSSKELKDSESSLHGPSTSQFRSIGSKNNTVSTTSYTRSNTATTRTPTKTPAIAPGLSSSPPASSRGIYTVLPMSSTEASELTIKQSAEDDNSPGGKVSSSKVKHRQVEDIILGGLTILMMITNLLGNIPALTYFIRKRRKSPDLFYTVISVVDIGISVCAIPVIISLMSYRNAVLFTDSVFCETWSVLFSLLMKVSMFLVMILNIFRTIAVVCPFYDIHSHDSKIIPGTLIYAAVLISIDVICIYTNIGKIKYRKLLTFCEMEANRRIASWETYVNIYSGLHQVEVLIPSLIALICFVITTVSLVRSSSRKASMNSAENVGRFRKITMTIAIFTAIFLVCNLPQFVEQVMFLATGFRRRVFKEKIIRNYGLWQTYGRFLITFLLTQLNSALNPCLYLARMPQFRVWLRERQQSIAELPLTKSSSSSKRSN